MYCWVDIFAITQHPGKLQGFDLGRLEATISRPDCTTLMVLDSEKGLPLTRCWCIFEVYCTLHNSNRHGKLQVRVGSVSATGDLIPCSDPDKLAALAGSVDVREASASVEADKAMILARLSELGTGDRDGTHELNRKLARATRHGW